MADDSGRDLSGASDKLELSGLLERVVFHSEDNGYTVFRFQPDGLQELLTVVGHLAAPQPGTRLRLTGRWGNHPRFGRQLNMDWFEEERPSGIEGIKLFLGSGAIKGIGPGKAAKIVKTFGEQTLDILDHQPERLAEVPGFGPKTVDSIKESWAEQRDVRDLMIFLQPHGLGPGLIIRIYRYYKELALNVVQNNPYLLAMDVQGIGFATADKLARSLGFAKDSRARAEAGLIYVLSELSDQGHVFYPLPDLVQKTSADLDIEEPILLDALDDLQRQTRIVIEDLGELTGVYLSQYHHYETKISFYLNRLKASPATVCFGDRHKSISKVVQGLEISLAVEQEQAVLQATQAKLMVLTGGPGTGKTTILNAIIQVFADNGGKVLLAAPTGRAAKRMSETSGREARTIHRLLEYSPQTNEFLRNENKPLACGLLVIDEASMIDTMLMYQLLKAVPLGATLLLVGDVNQLPSVGPGNVLRDIIASGQAQVVELTEVFRQAESSDIVSNAHLINLGQMPSLRNDLKRNSDFYFFKQNDPEQAADLIVDLVKKRIPQTFGFRPDQIQVLSPMLKGAAGVNNLNKRLQESLNPSPHAIVRGERKYARGDRVMQIRNNYDKDVYNGDIGFISLLDREQGEILVKMDERVVHYTWDELDELIPAYAISIHKSQGGEYPVVVAPLLMQHFMLLQRNLVYTAVTRGKSLVVLVGEVKALAIAVKNNQIRHRHTWLAHRLANGQPLARADFLPQTEQDFPDDFEF